MATITTAISAEGRVRSMADRHTLHISKLDDFKKWLVKDGWEIEEPKGIYEVLRARKQGRKHPLIVYKKADAKEHLSIMDRDYPVVGAFLRDAGKPKTNADRIRAMTDEELAKLISGLSEHCLAGIGACDCSNIETHPCYEVCEEIARNWLQSEVEE